MQYELAKIILPIVMMAGGYDSDINSVNECRSIIDKQEQTNEKSRTDWFVSLMGGDSHSGNTTATKRTPQASQLSGIHHNNP